MKKSPEIPTQPMRSFYHPHNRYATSWKNETVDLATGEIKIEPSMTKQSFVAECDINNILKQYKLTGQIRHISAKASMGAYEDLPLSTDFQEAMNLVLDAQASFATLPSHVRARFGNDPTQFLGFMADPSNLPEMEKLGLLKPRLEAPAAPPPVAAPEPPKG